MAILIIRNSFQFVNIPITNKEKNLPLLKIISVSEKAVAVKGKNIVIITVSPINCTVQFVGVFYFQQYFSFGSLFLDSVGFSWWVVGGKEPFSSPPLDRFGEEFGFIIDYSWIYYSFSFLKNKIFSFTIISVNICSLNFLFIFAVIHKIMKRSENYGKNENN